MKRCLIGLTGGIGCGKSTVIQLFEELLQFRTYETDAIVHHLLNDDASVVSAVKQRWGDELYDEKGTARRDLIAVKVFNNSDELIWLEQLLHPKVRLYWMNRVNDSLHPRHMVEIPLLFEKKLEKNFDLIVCVSTSLEQQMERLERRGISNEQARLRIQKQLPLSEKEQRSDIVIVNNSNLAFTRLQIQQIEQQLKLR
ncbi:MAG: dephospho-CoA kinase [Opitutales bacterium]|nr:dephospho-CoA kinase [Opitutales bacterium]